MSAITVDGDLVHYEVLGRGRPVVLLHSWLGSWRYWIPLMRQLQMKYRVYAIDLYGYGDSSKNPKKYPIHEQIALLREFMKKMDITKAAMIGHGLGTKQIAAKLDLSRKTVETYREHIKTKLGLANGTELTQHAVQWVLEQSSPG